MKSPRRFRLTEAILLLAPIVLLTAIGVALHQWNSQSRLRFENAHIVLQGYRENGTLNFNATSGTTPHFQLNFVITHQGEKPIWWGKKNTYGKCNGAQPTSLTFENVRLVNSKGEEYEAGIVGVESTYLCEQQNYEAGIGFDVFGWNRDEKPVELRASLGSHGGGSSPVKILIASTAGF